MNTHVDAVLTAVGDVAVISLNDGIFTQAGCQYVSGSGTIQIEATIDGDVWFTPKATIGGSSIAAQTGAGCDFLLIYGYSALRYRKTVGTTPTVCAIGVC